MAHHWGYLQHNGPSTWHKLAPAARGLHQSPVDIVTSALVYDPKLASDPLKIQYVPSNSKKLLNNGHSVQVVIDGEGSCLEGGPLPHKYKVEQFHFHWGKENKEGAEHLVNGKQYPAELHIVHWNSELYSSFADAARSSSGLTVLGVFLEVGTKPHESLTRITELLPQVHHAEESVAIPGGFDPATLLPADRSRYWTYTGSLTTPPCYESVRFIIFTDPVQVSEEQLNSFRALHGHKKGEKTEEGDKFEGRIVNNFRPCCPLNDRRILCSFRP